MVPTSTAPDGFQLGNQAFLQELQKALTSSYATDSAVMTGGRSLIPESLDKTLVSILWSQDEAKLFKKLKKQSVGSTVHEFTVQSGVGDEDGAWVSEGGSSIEKSQELARKIVLMKYLQTKRSVTLQMMTANTIENAENLEIQAGTLWLIRSNERALFTGNSAIIAEQPDGLDVLTPASNVIDLRGKTAKTSEYEDALGEAGRIIRDAFGRPTDVFYSTRVARDTQILLRDRIRVPANDSSEASASGGYVFKKYPTTFGDIDLNNDVFIKEGGEPLASSLTTLRPQVTPTITVAKANSASLFITADAGTYGYKIVAINKYGQGVASAGGSVAVVANDIVTVTVTNHGAITDATGYQIYRLNPGATKYLYMKTVPYSAGALVTDGNDDLPGTSRAYILNLDTAYDALEWGQFLPMMKFPLYPTDSAINPFLILLFGALVNKKPTQHVIIKNITAV